MTATLRSAQAQPGTTGAKFHPDSSYTAEALLRNADGHARANQWAEAVEIYQRVIDQFRDPASGSTVAQVPKDEAAGPLAAESRLFVDVRSFCQQRLAALPPEGRAVYRNRVDAQSRRWYEQGRKSRDRNALRRVVEEAFSSSWGDEALELLGDLAFQDGRFAEALSAYRQLAPELSGGPSGLVYPDPTVDLARVAAKALLCRAALGDSPPGEADLAAFRKAYPDARGSLAGRQGPLAEVVAEALARDGLAPPPQADGLWPTFAGSAARTLVAPGAIDVGSKQWTVPLDPVAPPRGSDMILRRSANPTSTERLLAYHPIVLGDQVVVCDEYQVLAYRLNARPEEDSRDDGAPKLLAWSQKLGTSYANGARNGAGLPRFTLTASGDRIFARLGPAGASPSTLIAIRNNRDVEGKRFWERLSTDVEMPPRRKVEVAGRRVLFEGAPVADARSVYIALTETGTMTSNYVASFDAETGAQRWVRYLGEATPPFDVNMGMGMGIPNLPDVGGRLLSLDGPTVYYQTNMGAVAALDAETGQIRWLATYPHREVAAQAAVGRSRELNPAIVSDGRVIVAPDDAPGIYAFDAATGRLLWKTRPLPEIAHVLGVARGHLFATGSHVLTIDVTSGQVVRVWPDGPGLKGYGRGLLAGDHVLWPTEGEIQVLDQSTGLNSDRGPIPLGKAFQATGGNLAVGDGYLVVAQADKLVVYCQNSRLIERYRDEIARTPDRAALYLRLARVAEATGQDDLALEALGQAIARAGSAEVFDGQPLVEAAWGGRHRLLMRRGRAEAAAGKWADAAARFADAAEAARNDRDRLDARLRLAEAQAGGGQAREAVATLQGLLIDGRSRALTVAADASRTRTVRADLLVTDRLTALLRERGRDLYAPFEDQARALLRRGREGRDARLLEEVGRTYPVAEAAPEALLALADLHAANGHPDEAARACARLLAGPAGDAQRGRALLALGRAYEDQQLWLLARDAYARALGRYAGLPAGEAGGGSVGQSARERLVREPLAHLAESLAEPALPVPLGRRWEVRLDSAARPIAADGVPPSTGSARLFLVDGGRLRAIDPADGRPLWTADLGGEPAWVGYLADRVLAATSARVVALDRASGSVAWRWPPEEPGPEHVGPDPFQRPEGAAARPEPPAGAQAPPAALGGFQLVGGRLFCRRGARELVALDGDNGTVEWSYAPDGGRLGPHAWIGPRHAVLQALEPNRIVVLETDRGRGHEYPQDRDAEPWARAPLPLDDDRVALALDAQAVALLDLRRGELAWTYREAPVLPYGGTPRLLGDNGRLLVLYGGRTLVRLDPSNGQRIWGPVTLGLEDLSDDPETLALDADHVYFASGGRLTALALADGQPAWSQHLAGPARGWVLALADRCVVAYPSPHRPSVGSLDTLPMVFCRRDNGDLVQRLLFPATVTDLVVRPAPRGLLVASQSELWSVGRRPAVDGATGHR